MHLSAFITVGENIHCTRIYKVGGKSVKAPADGEPAIVYNADGEPRELPIPPVFRETADWEAGRVKHCAVAVWQGTRGDAGGRQAGTDYLQSLARKQQAAGASYLDLNVDEFSTDVRERVALMKWTATVVQQAVSIPLSIDSSNLEILAAGLEACDASHGRPLVNSVSLERPQSIETAAAHGAVVIASCAGESGLPCTTEERLVNLGTLMPRLREAGFDDPDIHVDPLVLPISTDSNNGRTFLDAVSAIRKTYGDGLHIVAGLSNVSFGMPKRKLINQVFSYLAAEAGADGGIVDPLQINVDILNGLDPESEPFRMARALLTGEDEFGMNFITACREGTL